MKITVIGTGYVGLVTGACLAEFGNNVVCLDLDKEKIEGLKKGIIPIYEPGLEEIVSSNFKAGRLEFTTDIEYSVNHGDIQFIAVGTPPGEDGSADLKYVISAAENIATYMSGYKVIVNKSTVPVGTGDRVRKAIQDRLERRGISIDFGVVSNPEFLKEGSAVQDFMRPDRIVLGGGDPVAIEMVKGLYGPIQRNHERILVMDIRSAELTKYAANAMLATRISFMNELANLAEKVGADIESVRKGIGSDSRIGYSFLYAGCGYGGSCFPKDVRALQKTANQNDVNLGILAAVELANENQKKVLVNKVLSRFGKNLTNLKFAVWGLAFKPNTDDMREAPSLDLVSELTKRGAHLMVYDPVAMDNAKVLWGKNNLVTFCTGQYEVLDGAEALILVTEWKEFKSPDFNLIKNKLRSSIIFDGRNQYDSIQLSKLGFEYFPIGRRSISHAKIST